MERIPLLNLVNCHDSYQEDGKSSNNETHPSSCAPKEKNEKNSTQEKCHHRNHKHTEPEHILVVMQFRIHFFSSCFFQRLSACSLIRVASKCLIPLIASIFWICLLVD